jgi:hypothetical protein
MADGSNSNEARDATRLESLVQAGYFYFYFLSITLMFI